MNRLRQAVWWCAFAVCAIAAQAAVPGVDFLAVGVLVLLQERDYATMFWLLPLAVLLQEGMGTRTFGASVAWYVMVMALFGMGRRLFEAKNFVFIFLLSACLGAVHYWLAWLMAPLQNLPFSMQETMDTSLIQALAMPFAWWVLMLVRRGNAHGREH